MKKDVKTLLKLFTSTFYLSSFTFGGGYVIIPLMKKKFVDELNWIKEEEMYNLAAIAQSAPGAVAVNASFLVGFRVAGPIGGLVTILGTILPPLLIISLISLFYQSFRDNEIVNAVLKGMQSGVAAVIVDVTITMGTLVVNKKEPILIVSMIGAFIATFFFNINVIIIIFISGILGAFNSFFHHNKEEGSKL